MTSEQHDNLPQNVQDILGTFNEDKDACTEYARIKAELENIGWTCEYGLDGQIIEVEQQSKCEYSAEIKTEILEICEAFSLGAFKGFLSFAPSSRVDGYIFTQFETSIGRYNHYYRIQSKSA